MPVPLWVGKLNKRVFNPREISKGIRPVLIHEGRQSGKTFKTPLDAHPVDGGFIFIAVYGPRSDWVRNILAKGSARLEIDGALIDLVNPRLIDGHTARAEIGAGTKAPVLRIDDYLRMDVAA